MSSQEKRWYPAYYPVRERRRDLYPRDPDRSKKTKIKLRRCRSTRVGAIMREEDDSTVSGRLSNFLQCGFVRRRGSGWGKTSLPEHEEVLD